MSSIDPTVASLVDKTSSEDPTAIDEDALFAELENDDAALPSLRERRIQQLHEELTRAQTSRSSTETYGTIKTEKELLDLTTSVPRCIVHFFHPDFHRCSVMDGHLERLAGMHYEVRFVRADVKDVVWVCEKLGVKVLPCVIGFVEGKGAVRVVGFEGLGGDGFGTGVLEGRLVDGGVLVREKVEDVGVSGGGRSGGKKVESEDEDDDWD
jgi:hypothetical protein